MELTTEIESDLDRGRVYEIGMQIVPTLGDEGAYDKFNQIKARITELKGEIIAEGSPERMDLAYPMYQIRENKKTTYHEAYFAWIKFELDASLIKGLESELSNDLSIIRYIAFKTVRQNTYIPRKHPRKRSEYKDEESLVDEDSPLPFVPPIILDDIDDELDEEAESLLDKKLDELTSNDVE